MARSGRSDPAPRHDQDDQERDAEGGAPRGERHALDPGLGGEPGERPERAEQRRRDDRRERAGDEVPIPRHGGPWYRRAAPGPARGRAILSRSAVAPGPPRPRPARRRHRRRQSPPNTAPRAISPISGVAVRPSVNPIPIAPPMSDPGDPADHPRDASERDVHLVGWIVRRGLPADHLGQQHDRAHGHQHDAECRQPQADGQPTAAAAADPGIDLGAGRPVAVHPRRRGQEHQDDRQRPDDAHPRRRGRAVQREEPDARGHDEQHHAVARAAACR